MERNIGPLRDHYFSAKEREEIYSKVSCFYLSQLQLENSSEMKQERKIATRI